METDEASGSENCNITDPFMYDAYPLEPRTIQEWPAGAPEWWARNKVQLLRAAFPIDWPAHSKAIYILFLTLLTQRGVALSVGW